MGIFFIVMGMVLILTSFITGNWRGISILSVGVGQIGAGISMGLLYYFENRKQYLTLKKGELIKHTLFPKKIKLSEIKSKREFAGDLKLNTEKTEFIIHTQIIDPDSLIELKNILNNYPNRE